MIPGSEARADPRRIGWIAIAVTVALLGPTLVLRGSWPPDETRYADVGRAMLEDHAYLVPTLEGRLYEEKPPVFFWCVAGLGALGIPLDVAPRLLSVLSSVIVVALLPALGVSLGLSARAANHGALLLAATPIFLAFGQIGLIDGWLTMLVVVAILAKVRRAWAPRNQRLLWTLLEGLALAAGLLSKGPVVLLFPLGLRLGALHPRAGDPARWDRSDAVALAIALLLASAWLGAAGARFGNAYAMSLAVGQIAKRVSGDVPHPAFIGYLPLATCAALLPWLFFAMATAWRRRNPWTLGSRAAIAPLIGWLTFPVGLLALAPSQQLQYALPSFPAAALLMGSLLFEHSAPRIRGVRFLGTAAALPLLVLGIVSEGILPARTFDPAVRAGLAGDLALRSVLLGGGTAVLAAAWTPMPRGWGRLGWLRPALTVWIFFAGIVAILGRIDPWISGASLRENPAVVGARRLAAKHEVASLLRVGAGRSDAITLDRVELLTALRRDPELVGLITRRDLERSGVIGSEGFAADGLEDFEEVGRGWVRGKTVIALRAVASER